MKKIIITITILILITIGFILYKNKSNTLDISDSKNTALIVQDFINKMIPHHMEAVNVSMKVMNDLEISNPKARILAANIVDGQSFEIDQMKNIYREYLGGEYVFSTTTYHNMMRDVKDIKGDELLKVYKKDMIKHHNIAIDEAKDYIKKIDKIRSKSSTTKDGLTITNSHPAIDITYDLAKKIVETQKKEILEIKSW